MNKRIEPDTTNSDFKYKRILQIYTNLLKGEIVSKAKMAADFHVSERSIQRDLDDLRTFFDEQTADGKSSYQLIYSRKEHGYLLKSKDAPFFTNGEAVAVGKILVESRAFQKDELEPILQKLIHNGIPKEKQLEMEDLIEHELSNYVEPWHNQDFIETLWKMITIIKEHRILTIFYQRENGGIIKRKIKPIDLIFSESHFYISALIVKNGKNARLVTEDDTLPVKYRIDRIRSFEVLNKNHSKDGIFRED